MLVLRLTAPAFSLEQKKIMVSELTAAVLQSLQWPSQQQDRVVIQFMPYTLDNLAVGGRLLSETEAPIYQLECCVPPELAGTLEALQQPLTPLLLELLGLPASEAHRLLWLFPAFQRMPEKAVASVSS